MALLTSQASCALPKNESAVEGGGELFSQQGSDFCGKKDGAIVNCR